MYVNGLTLDYGERGRAAVERLFADACARKLIPAPVPVDKLDGGVRLDVPHVKAFWIATGVGVVQASLWFGVDDLDGTVQEERIYHMAGAPTPEAMTPAEIARLIRIAGREPVERDTFYNVVSQPGAGQ